MSAVVIPRPVREHLSGQGGHKVRMCGPTGDLPVRASAAKIPLDRIARARLLGAGKARLLAVHPADTELDIPRLSKLFRRRLEPCSRDEIRRAFPDCEPEALPPFGLPYGIKTIVDARLEQLEEVFFSPGLTECFVRSPGKSFAGLIYDAWRGRHIAVSMREQEARRNVFRRKIERVGKLPAMPAIAEDIVRMRHNPYTHASELAAVIEQDPSLSAQLIRYARSSFYAYGGRITDVEQAIVRVLGMDFVLDFTFGLALGRPFRNPAGGPLGLMAFWRHSVRAAALSQALCNRIAFARRPSPGIAYLSGLLHNFGFLLLGHLFPEPFGQLNKGRASQPDRSLASLEQEIVGVSHEELGVWLMEAWDMPREVIYAVRGHHDPGFRNDFSEYANLVCVANRLLQRVGIGDEEEVELPDHLLEALGLTHEQAEEALGEVIAESESLDYIARRAAA